MIRYCVSRSIRLYLQKRNAYEYLHKKEMENKYMTRRSSTERKIKNINIKRSMFLNYLSFILFGWNAYKLSNEYQLIFISFGMFIRRIKLDNRRPKCKLIFVHASLTCMIVLLVCCTFK